MSTLASSIRVQILKEALKMKVSKLEMEAQKRMQKQKKLWKAIYPHYKSNLSFMHKSILYEQDRKADISQRIYDAVGDITLADKIAPILGQQAMTAQMILWAIEEGLLDSPGPYLEVMNDFVDPMIDIAEDRPPLHWENAVEHNLLISAPQSFLNTVILGVDQHIDIDFKNSFVRQAQSRSDHVVLPQDWVSTYGAVTAVSEVTGPVFNASFGANAWSLGTHFLRVPLLGPLVYDRRNVAYIQYAKDIELDISEFQKNNLKLIFPDDEVFEEYQRLAKKKKLRERILEMSSQL
ncbi:hypothetical protein [uncultured Variovorax sp.]|uniref:hypothetical protein n=1 Tax=uncultured Variovorax sp. TaxID=114708 RepID=UPI0025FB6FDC|nr:hypothetical protein [uncultured Variovorax sp.]